MDEPIMNAADAVRELGALPMPVGPEPQSRSILDRARDALDARMTKDDLRLVLENVINYAAGLEAERHVTNEALDDAVKELRERQQREALVADFVAKRAEYITAIRNCHPDNGHDYDRWQGHAAARRQLAELLGMRVAWPPEDAASVANPADKLTRLLAPTQALREVPDGEHYRVVHHDYRTSHDMPETGGA